MVIPVLRIKKNDVQICNLQNGALWTSWLSMFLFRNHHCGKEYLRKSFMNVNKEVKYVPTYAELILQNTDQYNIIVIGEAKHFGPLG